MDRKCFANTGFGQTGRGWARVQQTEPASQPAQRVLGAPQLRRCGETRHVPAPPPPPLQRCGETLAGPVYRGGMVVPPGQQRRVAGPMSGCRDFRPRLCPTPQLQGCLAGWPFSSAISTGPSAEAVAPADAGFQRGPREVSLLLSLPRRPCLQRILLHPRPPQPSAVWAAALSGVLVEAHTGGLRSRRGLSGAAWDPRAVASLPRPGICLPGWSLYLSLLTYFLRRGCAAAHKFRRRTRRILAGGWRWMHTSGARRPHRSRGDGSPAASRQAAHLFGGEGGRSGERSLAFV